MVEYEWTGYYLQASAQNANTRESQNCEKGSDHVTCVSQLRIDPVVLGVFANNGFITPDYRYSKSAPVNLVFAIVSSFRLAIFVTIASREGP